MLALFADDTALLSVHESYDQAVTNLQTAINYVCEWASNWKLSLNESKSIRVDFALRHNGYTPTIINQKSVPSSNSKKYLGIHLDNELDWRTRRNQDANV